MKECAMTACSRTALKRSDYCERHEALCLIPGCERHVRTTGMCNTHYNNYLRKRKRTKTDQLCMFPNCYESKTDEHFCSQHQKEKQEYRKPRKCLLSFCDEWSTIAGHCEEHYLNYVVSGAPVKMVKLCGFPGCDEPHASRGMCQKHYAQWQRAFDKFYKGMMDE